MSVRNKISVRNPWYLSTHRFLELKHYCLQVPEWEKNMRDLTNKIGLKGYEIGKVSTYRHQSEFPNWNEVCKIIDLQNRLDFIKKVAKETDLICGVLIYESVTKGRNFEYLQTHYELPMSRDTWYRNFYRKFFWILDKEMKKSGGMK